MSVRQQNIRQSECLPIAGTGAAAAGLGFTQNSPPGGNPLAAMRLINPNAVHCYFAFGRGTATAAIPTAGTSSPVVPLSANSEIVVDIDPAWNFVSFIFGTSTTTGTVFACPGEGS